MPFASLACIDARVSLAGRIWIASLIRLMLYVALLWPGFTLMALFYFFSNRVRRNIWYGRQPRNLLDLYIPYRQWLADGDVPVVVFVTGGAWTIGYKAWGALMARRLSQRGVLVASLDYRNFPQVRPYMCCAHFCCRCTRMRRLSQERRILCCRAALMTWCMTSARASLGFWST